MPFIHILFIFIYIVYHKHRDPVGVNPGWDGPSGKNSVFMRIGIQVIPEKLGEGLGVRSLLATKIELYKPIQKDRASTYTCT